MSFDDIPGLPNSDGDLERALNIINDHAYDWGWLLDQAGWINGVIRTATHRDRFFHYAVDTLMNVLPTMLTGREFEPWWDRLIALLLTAQDLQDKDLIARLTVALARYQNMIGNPGQAEILLNRAGSYAEKGSRDTQLDAYAALIETYILAPPRRFDAALFETALSIAARSENNELKALIHQMVAVSYLHRHDFDRASFHIGKAQDQAAVLKDPGMFLRTLLISTSLTRLQGDFATCTTLLQKAREVYPMTVRSRRNYMQICYEDGAICIEEERFEDAANHFQDALTQSEGLEDSYETGLCHVGLASAHLHLGHLDEAIRAIEEAHDIWQYIGNRYLVVHAMYTRGYIELLRGVDPPLTRTLLVDALEAAQEIDQHAAREQLEDLIRDKLDRLGPAPV
ncbi:MAG: tetratricopeptide repeat protein [Chloroflexi bacterium]|nr:tetratricopeptide repeat protein [Chloroflexota bacterium]